MWKFHLKLRHLQTRKFRATIRRIAMRIRSWSEANWSVFMQENCPIPLVRRTLLQTSWAPPIPVRPSFLVNCASYSKYERKITGSLLLPPRLELFLYLTSLWKFCRGWGTIGVFGVLHYDYSRPHTLTQASGINSHPISANDYDIWWFTHQGTGNSRLPKFARQNLQWSMNMHEHVGERQRSYVTRVTCETDRGRCWNAGIISESRQRHIKWTKVLVRSTLRIRQQISAHTVN